ncbi:IclR family transcriptional regulator [Nocardioides sp. DS6]|uniref:IclR family transcriptional regulator n=1 Tax=Nocardioides eburneus TaxID=3231482 RepID=A0ABV3T3L4_9ACTN
MTAITPAADVDDVETAAEGDVPRPRRSSLGRVHQLLSAFDYEHTTLTLSQLSRRAGLPLSTTHRMVAEMVELGMLERDRDNDISIGIAVWRFGLLTPKTYGVQRVALPFMQDLYATTGLPIHLGIQQREEVTVVESLRPRGGGAERPRIGQRDPLHEVAVGTAILAFTTPAFQEHYLHGLDQRGSTNPTSAALRRELARIRAEGYAVNTRRTAPRISIGAPVLDRRGRPLGALSIIVPAGTAETPYGHVIRNTARAVQRTAWEQGLG